MEEIIKFIKDFNYINGSIIEINGLHYNLEKIIINDIIKNNNIIYNHFDDSKYIEHKGSFGGFIWYRYDNILIEDINIFEIEKYYPKIIDQLYLSNIADFKNCKNFSFIISNYDNIRNQLNEQEIGNLNFILNSKFTHLNNRCRQIVLTISNNLMKTLLDKDINENIYYIDVGMIVYKNENNMKNIIEEHFKDYKFETKKYPVFILIKKKRYILMKNNKDIKIHGIIRFGQELDNLINKGKDIIRRRKLDRILDE